MQSSTRKTLLRLLSILMLLGSIAIGINIWIQSRSFDDGGPPMGALCIAAPAVYLLIFAGALWEYAKKA